MSIILARSLILSVMLQLSDPSQTCINFFPNNKKINEARVQTHKCFQTYLDNLLKDLNCTNVYFLFLWHICKHCSFSQTWKTKKIKYFQLSEIQNIASQNECLWNGWNVKTQKQHNTTLKALSIVTDIIFSVGAWY